jgi:DNA anti-recombination protein RmuC
VNWLSTIKILFSLGESIVPFVKKNWKILLIIFLSAALYLKMRSDYKALETAFSAAQTSYEEQLRGLKEIHNEEMRQREDALREYGEELERINSRYENSSAELERRRSEDVRRVRKQFDHEPEEIKRQIISEFGFEYVE